MITMTDTPNHSDTDREHLVLPLFEIVVFPRTRTKIHVDSVTGELLAAELKDTGAAYAIGLTAKSGTVPDEVTPESLYAIGNLLEIQGLQPSDDGYLVSARAAARVKAGNFSRKSGRLVATCQPVPDQQDLDPAVHAQMLGDAKKIIREISSRFEGAEHFTRPIDQMESVDQVVGFVMPFVPAPVAEKQGLLEIVSVKVRAMSFLALLAKVRENINFRIEVAQKVSDKVSRANREVMLREQLRVIQEELGQIEGTGPADDGYREKIEAAKMPEDIKKKALGELRKLEAGGSQNHEAPVIRNYLDLLIALPWTTEEKKEIDIGEAKKVL